MHKHQEGQIWGEEGSKVCSSQCNMGPWGNQSSLARMQGTSGQAVRQLLSAFLSMAARSILSASLSAFALPVDFPASVPMGQRGTPWSPIFSGESDGSAKPMILLLPGWVNSLVQPPTAQKMQSHGTDTAPEAHWWGWGHFSEMVKCGLSRCSQRCLPQLSFHGFPS